MNRHHLVIALDGERALLVDSVMCHVVISRQVADAFAELEVARLAELVGYDSATADGSICDALIAKNPSAVFITAAVMIAGFITDDSITGLIADYAITDLIAAGAVTNQVAAALIAHHAIG